MGGEGINYDGPEWIPSQGCQTYYGYDCTQGKQYVMGVGLGRRGAGGYRYLDNKGVCEKAEGENYRVCCREEIL